MKNNESEITSLECLEIREEVSEKDFRIGILIKDLKNSMEVIFCFITDDEDDWDNYPIICRLIHRNFFLDIEELIEIWRKLINTYIGLEYLYPRKIGEKWETCFSLESRSFFSARNQ